jgi:uncharacterized phage-associated protein
VIFRIAEALLTFDSMAHDKLQKLCYFSYAWYLTFFGERLFEQKFEVWEKGPVCPELFEKYQKYGLKPIPKTRAKLEEIISEEELREFLKAIFDAYGHLSNKELIFLACSEDPWLKALQRLEKGLSSVYDDEEIVNWHTRNVLKELNKENICLFYI